MADSAKNPIFHRFIARLHIFSPSLSSLVFSLKIDFNCFAVFRDSVFFLLLTLAQVAEKCVVERTTAGDAFKIAIEISPANSMLI